MNAYIHVTSSGVTNWYETLEECKKQASLWCNDNPGKESGIYQILGSMKSEVVQAKFTEATKEDVKP